MSLPPGVDPSTIPSVPPPAGMISNFSDPPSISWAPRLAIYLTFPSMVIIAGLRVFVRLRRRQMGVDDYVLGAAVACAIAYNALLLSVFLNDAIGRHGWDTPITTYTTSYFQSNFATICVYNVTAALTKCSLLALIYRIFHLFGGAKTLVWSGVAVISLLYLIITILAMVYIIPRPGDGGWGSLAANNRSQQPAAELLAAVGVGGTVTDFYILFIPLFFVSKVFMSFRKRIGVGCIFLVGLIPCVCSTIGTVFRFKFLNTLGDLDGTWVGTQMQAFAITEINVGLICGCIPIVSTLLKSTYQWIESSWLSWRSFLTPSTRSKGSEKPGSSSGSESSPAPSAQAEIPRGDITGLWSYIQHGPSRSTRVEDSDNLVSTHLELQSADVEAGDQHSWNEVRY